MQVHTFSLDAELRNAHEQMQRSLAAIEEVANLIAPQVAEHFNDYIDKSVNPALPEGFSIRKDDHALYSNGKFTVYTGEYQTPSGPSKGPLTFEHIVMNLFNQYKKNTPWIETIVCGFDLPR